MADKDEVLDEILSEAPASGTVAEEQPKAETPLEKPAAEEQSKDVQVEEPTGAEEGETLSAKERQGFKAALTAERNKAKAKDDENADLRRQLDEMRGQINLLSQRSQPQPVVTEPPKKKEFWDDPDAFVQGALSPIEQRMQQQAETFSRTLAIKDHGRDVVEAAYMALGKAVQTSPQAVFELRRIMATDHPYEEMVQWHRRAQTLERIGPDPDAYINSELERRLSDPAEQAKILERIQASANRSSAPPVKLPPTLTKIAGGGLSSEGGESLADILKSR